MSFEDKIQCAFFGIDKYIIYNCIITINKLEEWVQTSDTDKLLDALCIERLYKRGIKKYCKI